MSKGQEIASRIVYCDERLPKEREAEHAALIDAAIQAAENGGYERRRKETFFRAPTREEMEQALGESAEGFLDGWTLRRCLTCRRPVAGGPTRCTSCVVREDAAEGARAQPTEPIPMLLWCPSCGARHLDEGGFATKPHHTHACQGCGMVWRPAIGATVGVRFLPGFKNGDGGAR